MDALEIQELIILRALDHWEPGTISFAVWESLEQEMVSIVSNPFLRAP